MHSKRLSEKQTGREIASGPGRTPGRFFFFAPRFFARLMSNAHLPHKMYRLRGNGPLAAYVNPTGRGMAREDSFGQKRRYVVFHRQEVQRFAGRIAESQSGDYKSGRDRCRHESENTGFDQTTAGGDASTHRTAGGHVVEACQSVGRIAGGHDRGESAVEKSQCAADRGGSEHPESEIRRKWQSARHGRRAAACRQKGHQRHAGIRAARRNEACSRAGGKPQDISA